MNRLLVDTGPLVAILSEKDHYHGACVEVLHAVTPPLRTCWPVITEAAWLLRTQPAAIERLLHGCSSGFLAIAPLDSEDAAPIARILKRYQDLKPELADASLVWLAERESIDTVFTLDQRDFGVYRIGRNRPFKLTPSFL